MEGKISIHMSSDLSTLAREGFLSQAQILPDIFNWGLGRNLAAVQARANPGGEVCVRRRGGGWAEYLGSQNHKGL